MQTFLPDASYTDSLRALNNQRLNKQILECRQIIKIIESDRTTGAYVNHPCVKMWRDYLLGLKYYTNIAIDLALDRGIKLKNTTRYSLPNEDYEVYPPWYNAELIISHQANLWRKAIDDANGLKRDGTPKTPNVSQLQQLIKMEIPCPDNFQNIPYYWPVK